MSDETYSVEWTTVVTGLTLDEAMAKAASLDDDSSVTSFEGEWQDGGGAVTQDWA